MKNPLLFLLLLIFSFKCYAQPGKLFTVDKELSNSIINSIYQDKRGYIWIATEDGLNCYDGAKFSVFRHAENDKRTLPDDNVKILFEDNHDHFLVGTIRGLSLYDPATDCFLEIPLKDVNGEIIKAHITMIIERKNGELLISTSGSGIYSLSFDGTNPRIVRWNKKVPSNFINSIYEDADENLWMATPRKGLYCIYKNGSIKQFESTDVLWNGVTSFCLDSSKNLYIGTVQGLYKYLKESKTFVSIPYELNSKLPITFLYSIGRDDIYVGTSGYGVKRYNVRTKCFYDEKFNVSNPDFFKTDVHSLFKDHAGNLWIGINTKGVMLLPAMTSNFKYFGYKSTNGIGVGNITSLCQDSNNVLWLGTFYDGIYGISSDNKVQKHFKHNNSINSVPIGIVSMYEDSEKNIWLGSDMAGMAKIDIKTGNCTYIALKDHKEQVQRISAFAEDKSKRLWIGTMGWGLFFRDLKSGKTIQYGTPAAETKHILNKNALHNRWITCLLYTKSNRLYIGTVDGLGCLDLKTMSFVSAYKKNRLFAKKLVNVLYEDDKGTIWVGTSDCLISLNEKDGRTRTYTVSDGLPNNVICAIEGDDNNNLWISTNYGISCFNIEKGTFVNYNYDDGLQGNEFNKRASARDKNNNLIFGGINGITYFSPDRITPSCKKTVVKIVDFYLNNKAVKKGTESGGREILRVDKNGSESYHLSYKDNSFTIEFSAMEFYNPERITYMYSLNNKKWIILRPGINKVSFSDLPPGTYHFKVKSKNYITYSDEAEIVIIISSAWYASNLAILIYIIVSLGLIYYIYVQIRHRYRIRQQILKHLHAEEINEAKLQFFINISHEIRTPMSLIISPLAKLIKSDPDIDRQRQYSIISQNSERILRLVNQLMDIRKIDKGQMKLIFRETNIVSFTSDLCKTFEQQFEIKNIKLNFECKHDEIRAWIDPVNFDKVIINLLSNAFKFTPKEGHVTVTLDAKKNDENKMSATSYIEIIVADDGKGIEEKELKNIFERFYQIRNSESVSSVGTGIGLHLTRSLVTLHHGTICAENNKDGKGCRFIIRIPLGKEHLSSEDLVDDNFTLENVSHDTTAFLENPVISEEIFSIASKTMHYILVVEDDDEIRKYICRELKDDFSVAECSNGDEALSMILKKVPDLVISDVMMPGMDGFTLCRKIKQNININYIPVILLTAKSSDEDTKAGLEEGADAYIVKPFNVELLRYTVKNLIKNREKLRKIFSGAQLQEDKLDKIEAKSPDDRLMDRIMRVINANISNADLTVDMVAEKVGISRGHLHRKLKELTNQTTSDFIRNIRLKQAATLLSEKRYSIAEIASLTGFANTNYFATLFKEAYGVTPTAYMENALKISHK